jgi:hypothetical protein
MKIINLIKEIGFVENNLLISNYTSYWVYNKWVISIHNYTIEHGWEKRWSFHTSDGKLNTENFAIDDIKPLQQYFKLELREIKLNELGV